MQNYPSFDYHHAMPTPWGKADHAYKICDGVYDVGTPGHGGIMVGKAKARILLSEKAIARGMKWNQYICFEEDCDWSLFAFEQPKLYADSFKKHSLKPEEITEEYVKNSAKKSIERWYPEYFI